MRWIFGVLFLKLIKMKQAVYIRGCQSLIVCLTLATYCYSNGHGTFGKYEYGICPSEESKFTELVKISIRDCVKKCAVRPICKVVGYNRSLKKCSLHLETSGEYVAVRNPQCVQIKMETVNVAQLMGDCKCADWQVCDIKTGECVTEECAPLLHPVMGGVVLGNTASAGAVKRVRCIDGLATNQPDDSMECQNTGEWSSVPKCTGALSNIALRKPATQSTTTRPAYLGVDGNTSQNLRLVKSCFHTRHEVNPWWRVDLIVVSYISYARLYNRIDENLGVRAHDIAVSVGETLDLVYEVAFIPGILPSIKNVQFPDETYARIFQLTIRSASETTKDYFHLCEVEIFGYPVQEI